MAPHTLAAPEKHHICIVSPDYRLAPQTRMPGILADVAAAVSYVRSDKFASKTSNRVDTSRIAFSGSSAGAWLALLAATGVGFEICGVPPPEPPLAVAPFYPFTDILDVYWSTKHRPYYPRIIEESEMAEYLYTNALPTCNTPPDIARDRFYHYAASHSHPCLSSFLRNNISHLKVQEAIFASLLLEGTGIDPSHFSIPQAIAAGSHTAPPMFITHGTGDVMVPVTQSIALVAAMEGRGIPVEYIQVEGARHLYDLDASYKMEEMYSFIRRIFSDH